MIQKAVALTVAFGMLAQQTALAAPKETRITWNELRDVAVEKRVSTVLPDGTRLEGEVLAVRAESLVLDVNKTSHKKLHPKGQQEIPRASIGEIRVIRHRGAGMRIVGGILGAIGGLAAVSGLAFLTENVAVLIPGFVLIIPTSAVAGYYAGKLADRSITRLVIQPETAAPAAAEEEQ
jgi:hypothetical protein